MKMITVKGDSVIIQALKLNSLLKVNRKVSADLELLKNVSKNAESIFLYPLSLISLN